MQLCVSSSLHSTVMHTDAGKFNWVMGAFRVRDATNPGAAIVHQLDYPPSPVIFGHIPAESFMDRLGIDSAV